MSGEESQLVSLDTLFGRVELETRMVRNKTGFDGQGRSLRYDRYGVLIETTPWRTNMTMTCSESVEFPVSPYRVQPRS